MKRKNIPLGRPSVLRHTNAHSILKLLRDFGSCSRADLVRASGLSAPTVTNVVKDLLLKDLIEPLGEGESSGGRPPDIIRFKAERGCLLAVEISAGSISFLLTDLNGIEMETRRISLAKRNTTPEAICGEIGKELKKLLRKRKKTLDHLLAMVVGVPGIANVEEGSVLSISRLEGWRSVPLRAMLSKIVKCTVIVENDMNLAAQGEQFCGAAQSEKDFILIEIGTNVGAGIFLDGKIHHGSQWCAGEIGYLRVPSTSRRQPTIHEFGELEKVLTSSGILKSWREESEKRAKGAKHADREVDAGAILDLAQSGDARAGKLIRKRAEIVADIIIDLSLILNPSLILLGGEVGSHPVLIEFVRQQLVGSEFAVTRIGSGTPGNRALLWGGISLALEAIPSVLLPQPPM
ncbi:MAG: ROK family transcriptional regulator [Acidobacteriaceae bacterium]